ncbi:MAG: starch synthase, partial [Gammaproteobacteria bacterium]|nr:starch synthase [Gammaproteobacteria bacterium]
HLFDQDDLRRGCVNFLRTGLLYTDLITTVSPTYAREIRTDAYGMGLDPLLRARSDRLAGILNGVDYDE